MSAGTGGAAIESVELRLDAALAATPGVITSTQPKAAVQPSNANGAVQAPLSCLRLESVLQRSSIQRGITGSLIMLPLSTICS